MSTKCCAKQAYPRPIQVGESAQRFFYARRTIRPMKLASALWPRSTGGTHSEITGMLDLNDPDAFVVHISDPVTHLAEFLGIRKLPRPMHQRSPTTLCNFPQDRNLKLLCYT